MALAKPLRLEPALSLSKAEVFPHSTAIMPVEAPATILFSLFYFLFSMGLIFQFKEFAAIGLSPENLLSSIPLTNLISEELRFVHHHMIKSSGTLVIHSLIPATYIVGYSYFTTYVDGNHPSVTDFLDHWPLVKVALTVSLVVSLGVFALAYCRWHLGDLSAHPFAKKFRPYLTPTLPLWSDVAKDINTEFRRIDKFLIRVNPVEKVKFYLKSCSFHNSIISPNLHLTILFPGGRA